MTFIVCIINVAFKALCAVPKKLKKVSYINNICSLAYNFICVQLKITQYSNP